MFKSTSGQKDNLQYQFWKTLQYIKPGSSATPHKIVQFANIALILQVNTTSAIPHDAFIQFKSKRGHFADAFVHLSQERNHNITTDGAK